MRKSDSDSRSFPVVTLKKRLLVNDPFHRKFCWDLLIYDSDGNRTLEDVASERKYAERLLRLFRREQVGSVQAPDVLEDLFADPEYLE